MSSSERETTDGESDFGNALRILARIIAEKHLSTLDNTSNAQSCGQDTDSPDESEHESPENGVEE